MTLDTPLLRDILFTLVVTLSTPLLRIPAPAAYITMDGVYAENAGAIFCPYILGNCSVLAGGDDQQIYHPERTRLNLITLVILSTPLLRIPAPAAYITSCK